MFDKVIVENGGMLMFIPDRCNDQNMCNKAVDSYSHALRSITDCYKILKSSGKAVSTYPSTIQFVPDQLTT